MHARAPSVSMMKTVGADGSAHARKGPIEVKGVTTIDTLVCPCTQGPHPRASTFVVQVQVQPMTVNRGRVCLLRTYLRRLGQVWGRHCFRGCALSRTLISNERWPAGVFDDMRQTPPIPPQCLKRSPSMCSPCVRFFARTLPERDKKMPLAWGLPSARGYVQAGPARYEVWLVFSTDRLVVTTLVLLVLIWLGRRCGVFLETSSRRLVLHCLLVARCRRVWRLCVWLLLWPLFLGRVALLLLARLVILRVLHVPGHVGFVCSHLPPCCEFFAYFGVHPVAHFGVGVSKRYAVASV